MKNIPIEELFKLKEQGMTDEKIVEHLAEYGIRVSKVTVGLRLKKYYESIGKKKPWGRSIKDEELVALKEQRKSDREIAEYFTKRGKKISLGSVSTRLKKYYTSKKMIKPKVPNTSIVKEEISTEEILMLRERGLTLREIVSHFQETGRSISHVGVNNRIKNSQRDRELEFKRSLRVDGIIPLIEKKTNNGINYAEQDREK